MNKVILNLAQTIDGYICRNDGTVDFLPEMPEDLGEEFNKFLSTIDVILMGRQTYEEYKSYGFDFYGDSLIYVWTRTAQEAIGKISFHTKPIKEILLSLDSKTIWCFGGTKVIEEFMKDNLIDEYHITTVPYLLGKGKKLFTAGDYEQGLELISTKVDGEMITTKYRRKSHD